MIKRIEIAVSVATLATSANAAIIGIAAKPFDINGRELEYPVCYGRAFSKTADATISILEGFDFNSESVNKLRNASKEVQRLYGCNFSIKYVLDEFEKYITEVESLNKADEVNAWFDEPTHQVEVLRNAYNRLYEKGHALPWLTCNTRDAKTFVKEGLALLADDAKEKPSFNYCAGDTVREVEKIAHDVCWVREQLLNGMYGSDR